MKTFLVPTPGGVDTTFLPHPDCTMLYTEQLSWFWLKFMELASNNQFEIVNWRNIDSEVISPVQFSVKFNDIDSLSDFTPLLNLIQGNVSDVARKTGDLFPPLDGIQDALEAIQLVIDTYPDYLEMFDKFTKDAGALMIDYDGNPVDGLSNLISFVDSDFTSFTGWLSSALTASEDDLPIPALPLLAVITRFVPAKYALIIKFLIDIAFKLLMSYIKGRLEHPNAPIGDIKPLLEMLKTAFLDGNEESYFAPDQLTEDWCLCLQGGKEEKLKIFPRWNTVDVCP